MAILNLAKPNMTSGQIRCRPVIAGTVNDANPAIILTTINARYYHTALGLRCLYNNLGPLKAEARILEFNLNHPAEGIVQQLLNHSPKIIAFGIYIWNLTLTIEVIQELKRRAPQITVVAGGPEVSYEYADLPLLNDLDYLITGEGEFAFALLCNALLVDNTPPAQKVISAGRIESLENLEPPYSAFTDEDVAQRIIYVESTRGCPFRCEFCLSSLTRKVRYFPQANFLNDLSILIERGARRFKFIDRTFNVNDDHALALLDFFEARWIDGMQLHFEIVPDHISPIMLERFLAFPPGGLHLEAGIQTFKPHLLALISRSQDAEKTITNLRRLMVEGGADIHADLIVGLPGQTRDDFADDFRRIFALAPQDLPMDIQLGVLKRLKGAPIDRHTITYQMNYDPKPTYEIISTSTISEYELTELKQMIKFTETICNHERFPHVVYLIRQTDLDPFEVFADFGRDAFEKFGRTYGIPMTELSETLFTSLSRHLPIDDLSTAIKADFYSRPGRKEVLNFSPHNSMKTEE